jgi:hypothetical protein
MIANGGAYRMATTIGQADAGAAESENGATRATTGFWSLAVGQVMRDDFESGDFSGWSVVVGGDEPTKSSNPKSCPTLDSQKSATP